MSIFARVPQEKRHLRATQMAKRYGHPSIPISRPGPSRWKRQEFDVCGQSLLYTRRLLRAIIYDLFLIVPLNVSRFALVTRYLLMWEVAEGSVCIVGITQATVSRIDTLNDTLCPLYNEQHCVGKNNIVRQSSALKRTRNNVKSEKFVTKKSFRHGGALSPTIFNATWTWLF